MPLPNLSRVPRTQRRFLVLVASACFLSTLLWISHGSGDGREWGEWMEWKRGGVGDGETNLEDVVEEVIADNKIVILMWTKYYEVKGEALLRSILMGRKWDDSCCAGEVQVTLDRRQLDRATAVVFFNYPMNLMKKDLPKTRRLDQLWVLFGKESPHLSSPLTPFNSLFNWTMTYRHDSDIWAPYGELLKLDKPIPEKELNISGVPLDSWVSGKTDLLAGVISHCPTPSRREDYVKLLRSADLPVDIYGSCRRICNKSVCSRRNPHCDHTAWWNKLASKYKFYFAAENAICLDYITEKFWRALEIGLVPVAYGGGNYSSEAPPNSFIDVREFPSHKELIAHLLYLDKNDEEYKKYFKWRSKYHVRMGEGWQSWCDLCKAVREFRRKLDENGDDDPNILASLSHSHGDLGRWWAYKPPHEKNVRACTRPNFK